MKTIPPLPERRTTPGVSDRAAEPALRHARQGGPKGHAAGRAARRRDPWACWSAHHLPWRAWAALEAGRPHRPGEIVLVPRGPNPDRGWRQRVLQSRRGPLRPHQRARTFNRHYADPVRTTVASQVEGKLDVRPDAQRPALIRDAPAARAAAALAPHRRSRWRGLRRVLLGLSIDADIVLDLHCDSQGRDASVHPRPPLWPQGPRPLGAFPSVGEAAPAGRGLSGRPSVRRGLLPRSGPRLAARFGQAARPSPSARGVAVTVELRGEGRRGAPRSPRHERAGH